jgi:hypothetical protein
MIHVSFVLETGRAFRLSRLHVLICLVSGDARDESDLWFLPRLKIFRTAGREWRFGDAYKFFVLEILSFLCLYPLGFTHLLQLSLCAATAISSRLLF